MLIRIEIAVTKKFARSNANITAPIIIHTFRVKTPCFASLRKKRNIGTISKAKVKSMRRTEASI